MIEKSFLDRILSAGFQMEVRGDKLVVTPAKRLNNAQRAWIRKYKTTLLAEFYRRNLPEGPCEICHCGHFWLTKSGWRCSGCHPWTDPGADTCCLPSADQHRVQKPEILITI